jgi:exopolysaccharide biosynthesis WecB/TagA/CpsF family protein
MAEVTVFMPVYNALPYLPEAVESIRRQSLADWCLLVVDDGSTDGSSAYLRGLEDPRICVLRQAHQGPATASNLAIARCVTPLFARMDADDVAEPTRLEEQLAFLRRHPAVGLLGTQIRPLGAVRAGRPSCLPTEHGAIMADLLRGRHALCNPTLMGRTELLRQVGGYRADGVLEDWTMFLNMGCHTELANLDRALLRYRIHAASTNARHTAELRARVAYACQQARRQLAGLPPLGYAEFQAARRTAPAWRRALWAMEAYAMTQYQRALAESLGPRPLGGQVRLAWAACCSPPLTLQRLARAGRKRLKLLAGSAPPPPPATDRPPATSREAWPAKHDLFGVKISETDYEEAVGAILGAARRREPAVASCQAVHAVMTAARDPALRHAVNGFDMVAPDGQPVRWALRLLHGVRLSDRVYGPELMRRLCREAAAARLGIYLYGSSPEVLRRLRQNLVAEHPGLRIAGAESPPFRPLEPAEEEEVLLRIEASGAELVLVGLGAPKQDWFAHRVRDRVRLPLVCVGAAFDFHAGTKPMAPAWMQRAGLEWLFRLLCEPRRLARRYLVTNTLFLAKLAGAMARSGGRGRAGRGPGDDRYAPSPSATRSRRAAT